LRSEKEIRAKLSELIKQAEDQGPLGSWGYVEALR